MNQSFKITAKTLGGFEETLADEIKRIGGSNISIGTRSVFYSGSKEVLYKSNLHLRTAIRILVPFKDFTAKNEKEFYKNIYDVKWENFITHKNTIALDSAVNSNIFRHSKFVAQLAKDAIVDRIRNLEGKRPSVDLDNPDLRINIHIKENHCTLSLDSSGDSLHKRGYRIEKVEAPLSEVLAAGLVLLTGWNGETKFIDPMCGSGTVPIEACLIARNIPPNYYRENFGFQKWKDYDAKLWHQIKNEAKENFKDLSIKIIGTDISLEAVEIARRNVERAKLDENIIIKKESITEAELKTGPGIVVTNPPYGERLKKENIEEFYKKLGDSFKQNFKNFDVWIFSYNKNALKHFGLRTSKRLTLFNGPLECKYHKYSIYEGSKKQFREE
ncbi:MAG: class I SAM-dependent RNA methyltransferase [Bacteroidota bacterium]